MHRCMDAGMQACGHAGLHLQLFTFYIQRVALHHASISDKGTCDQKGSHLPSSVQFTSRGGREEGVNERS